MRLSNIYELSTYQLSQERFAGIGINRPVFFLKAVFSLILFVHWTSLLSADTVRVGLQNPSFEYPSITQGTLPYKRVEGWQRKEYLHHTSSSGWSCPELRNPLSGVMPSHGKNYLWCDGAEIFQIPTNVEANTIYTCGIDVRANGTPSFTFTLSVRDLSDPYRVEMAKADSKNQSSFPALSIWRTASLVLNSSLHPEWVGHPLMIIINANGVAVDNVVLTKTVASQDVAQLTIQGPAGGTYSIEPGTGTFAVKKGDPIGLRAFGFSQGGQAYIFDHWVGNVSFPFQSETTLTLNSDATVEAVYVPADANVWDVKADTWVATDALGRKLADYVQAGSYRDDKIVGIYYVLWFTSEARDYQGPYDITKLLAANPTNPAWGPQYVFHHWGEPELGYYKSIDDWVMKKHARMLSDAGVDVVMFEATNVSPYTTQYLTFCDALKELKQQGFKVPKICFWATTDNINVVYDEFYSKGVHSDLWFYWNGKPLILCSTINATLPTTITDFFTVRTCWDSVAGLDIWPSGYFYPQGYGWHQASDIAEQTSVTVARHATSNVGRSYHGGQQPAHDQYGLTGSEGQGLFFDEQFSRLKELDPNFFWVAEWNEWCAMRFIYPTDSGSTTFLGHTLQNGESWFVDQYNAEYSRDIEPVKGGYNDNYYYQFVNMIREFKGVHPPDTTSHPKTMVIDGDFAEWADVTPEYRDYINDVEHRNELGYADSTRYINTTGRNDFVVCKVARDSNNIYFYTRTNHAVTPYTDPNWMFLFIDSDQNSATGWQGYDYLVNYNVINSTTTTLKHTSAGWSWVNVSSGISYAAVGNELELCIPKSLIGLSVGDAPVVIDFHWADNIQVPNSISEFAISGDSAPDRRFNYRYDSSVGDKACDRIWGDGQGKAMDLDGDCDLDIDDLALLAVKWLNTYTFTDFADLANDWLDSYLPESLTKVMLLSDGFETGNFSNYSWQTSGNKPWTVVSGSAYNGGYSAKSGAITHSQTSGLSIQVNAAETSVLSFYYKVSSEANYDYLKFFIDNVEQAKWSGITQPWFYKKYTVSPGTHTFKWTYTKDGSVSSGSDCACIDKISFISP